MTPSWTDERAWLQARVASAIQHGYINHLSKDEIALAIVRACISEQISTPQLQAAIEGVYSDGQAVMVGGRTSGDVSHRVT